MLMRTTYTSATVELVLFPATSVPATAIALAPCVRVTLQLNAVPVIEAAAPLHVTLAALESASEINPWMVACAVPTAVPFAGEVTFRTGDVLSRFTEAVAVAVFPTPSVAVPLMA
jgi:hypothetical protein